jgi:orotidine-5'-phosphate decarboxylase
MAEGFGDRLVARVAERSPLCVGLDPSSGLLGRWGLADDPGGVEAICATTIEAVAAVAAAVKPQVAYFERHGSAGIAVLERVLAMARAAGLLVVADAKRGDIDATMAAYGEAWLSEGSPLAADAMTVTPYLGLGAMAEVFELAARTGRGLFCVVASSNPEGRMLQEATTAEGPSVEEHLLGELARANRSALGGDGGLGPFGAVVGATRQAGSLDLGSLGGPFLVPGVGAQGATPDDVGALFAGVPAHSVLVNASRSILGAGPGATEIERAARQLADQLRQSLAG